MPSATYKYMSVWRMAVICWWWSPHEYSVFDEGSDTLVKYSKLLTIKGSMQIHYGIRIYNDSWWICIILEQNIDREKRYMDSWSSLAGVAPLYIIYLRIKTQGHLVWFVRSSHGVVPSCTKYWPPACLMSAQITQKEHKPFSNITRSLRDSYLRGILWIDFSSVETVSLKVILVKYMYEWTLKAIIFILFSILWLASLSLLMTLCQYFSIFFAFFLLSKATHTSFILIPQNILTSMHTGYLLLSNAHACN